MEGEISESNVVQPEKDTANSKQVQEDGSRSRTARLRQLLRNITLRRKNGDISVKPVDTEVRTNEASEEVPASTSVVNVEPRSSDNVGTDHSKDFSFDDVFAPDEIDSNVDDRIAEVAAYMEAKHQKINPFTIEYFQDPNLFYALPEEIRSDTATFAEYIRNTGEFNNIVHTERSRASGDQSGLLGDELHLPEYDHGDGKTWSAEDGYILNIDYLISVGVEPTKVLFFRRTQPMGDSPKPERYWSSDYFETVKGLTQEIKGNRRESSLILVADLGTINENGGLIQDVNDDNGLSVRQIDSAPFDQSRAVARVSK